MEPRCPLGESCVIATLVREELKKRTVASQSSFAAPTGPRETARPRVGSYFGSVCRCTTHNKFFNRERTLRGSITYVEVSVEHRT